MADVAESWDDIAEAAPRQQESWDDISEPVASRETKPPNTDSPFPQPVMDKADQFAMSPGEFDMAKYGSGMEDVAKAFGKSFYDSVGPERLGLSKESEDWLNKHGVFTHFEDEKTNPLSAFGALFGAAATVLDGANRTVQGLYAGAQAAGVAMGLPKDVVAIPDAFMGSPHPTGTPKPYVKPTPIEPIRVGDTPSPIAKPRVELAQTGIPHVDAILNSEPVKSVVNDPVIDRSHTIPNSWSGSDPIENPTTYIDKSFPKELEVDGIKWDPAEPAAVRENVEERAYDALVEGGMTPDVAQKVAYHDAGNPAENAWYASHSIDPEKANAKMQPVLDRIDQARDVSDVPEDMFRGMYTERDPAKALPGPFDKPTEAESQQGREILERKFLNGRVATAQEVLNTARDLDVIGPPKPEPAFEGSPSEQAEQAWPVSLSSAATPVEEQGGLRGHKPGEYDARGKEWVAKIDQPDDVRAAIEGIANDHDWFPEARGGVASPAARKAVAEAAGVDPAGLDGDYFAQHFDSDGKVRAVIQALRQTAKDVSEAAELNVKTPSVENAATLAEAQLRHTHVLEYTMGLRAESGRTLAAWKDLLREQEHTKATTEIRKKEVAGDTPQGTASVVDAVKDVQDNLKAIAKGEKPGKLGIQNLIDQAKKLAEGEFAPKEEGAGPRAPMSPELKELADAAKKVVDRFGTGDKTALDALVKQAEREAVNMTKSKAVKDPVEALPPELQALVDKSKRVTERFGGTARPEQAALLLARTGKTAAEQEQLARSVAGLTPNQVAKVLEKVRTSKLAEQPSWGYWLWQQGLISGLITHTKYLAVNTGQIIAERFVSPMVSAGIGKLRGQDASLMAPVYGNMAMIHQVGDAVTAAREAFRTGQRVPLASELRLFERGEESPQAKGAVNPYDVRSQGPDWGVWKRVFNEDQLDGAAKVLGIPGRSANMIHTFFKVLSERADLSTQAFEKAHSEGVTGDRLQQRAQYHLDNPTDAMLERSVNEAYSGAFMEKLEGGWAKASGAMNNFPVVGKWLFPFRHIPINIVRKGVEYSPAAVLDSNFRSALMGEKGAPAQNLAIAKMAVGSSIIGYFMHKGLADEATAEYPKDPKERLQWQLTGKQPFSIRMGDQWVAMERLGPLGMVANLGASLGSIVRHYDGQDDDALSKAITAGGMAAVGILGNEAGFQSLQNAIEAMKGDEKKLQKFLSMQAASVVPSLLSQPASGIDPYQRKADNLIAALKYRVPWLRESLPVKRDPLYGEPLPNPGYHALFRSSQISQDPVRAELDRLKIYPTQPQNNVGGVKLPDELYDKYQELHGSYTRQMLEPVVKSPGWSNAPPFARADAIQGLRKSATEAAKAQMQAMHPEIVGQAMKDEVSKITGGKKTKLQAP